MRFVGNRRCNRRAFLLGSLAASLLPPLGAAAARRTETGSAEPMSARVVIGDRTFLYEETAGEDLGDFAGNGFVQRCVRVVRDDCPLTVFFRPDRGSGRAEAVFELASLWQPTRSNLGSYSVTIRRGDRDVVRIAVPRQWHFARWRWQSAPRPVRADPAALIRAGLLPPYNSRIVPAVRGWHEPISYEIMGLAGVAAYMPMTGEREDIGLVTEAQAEYICTGSAGALRDLLAQAEASGSIPWNMRDERTGAPVDFEVHPMVQWYGENARGEYVRYPEDTEALRASGVQATPDTAHMPALAYVPYLLTGDPYYLEALQFQWTWGHGWMPPGYRVGVVPPERVDGGQPRAQAWLMRSLMQLAKVTPEETPRWLLPRAYWQRALDHERTWFDAIYLRSREVPQTVFRSVIVAGDHGGNDSGVYGLWQEDFQVNVYAWAALLGCDGWMDIFRWKVDSNIKRTNGRNGWRPNCTPYRAQLRQPHGGPWASSWLEAWNWSRDAYAEKMNISDPNKYAPSDFTYLFYMRAALAMAKRFGIPEADECFAWADREVRRLGPARYRWAIA